MVELLVKYGANIDKKNDMIQIPLQFLPLKKAVKKLEIDIPGEVKMARRGSSIMELLLAACILSVSLVPLFYLFNITKKNATYSEKEFLACLLAQHVMEEVVAFCSNHPESLPPITNEEPIVTSQESPETVSSYFSEVLGKPEGLNEIESPALFWSLKPFRCRVDTYLLENNLYKVIVYILYEENDRKKQVFLERLLARNSPSAPMISEKSHE